MKKLLLILLTALDVVTRPAASETLPPIHSRTLDEATQNKILLISEGGEPRSLDPQAAQGVLDYYIIMGLIEGLVGCHPTDQSKEVPAMADRWEHNDNYSIWTFHIGEDRKWSNGDPVTAQDFVFSYQRLLTASFGAPYADMLFILKGAEDYYRGKTKNFGDAGVKALDDHHLQPDLVGPT